MAESQDLEQQCVTAFKQGNHDQAVQLLPQFKNPATVTAEFDHNNEQEIDVTLLHLAAYHAWLARHYQDFTKKNLSMTAGTVKASIHCIMQHHLGIT